MLTIDVLLSALSHPARRSALRLLAGGEEHCLCELMARLGVSQSSMSRHMATLRDAGLITDRRDAQWMRYRLASLDDAPLQAVVAAVLHDEALGSIGSPDDLDGPAPVSPHGFAQFVADIAAIREDVAQPREAEPDRLEQVGRNAAQVFTEMALE